MKVVSFGHWPVVMGTTPRRMLVLTVLYHEATSKVSRSTQALIDSESVPLRPFCLIELRANAAAARAGGGVTRDGGGVSGMRERGAGAGEWAYILTTDVLAALQTRRFSEGIVGPGGCTPVLVE